MPSDRRSETEPATVPAAEPSAASSRATEAPLASRLRLPGTARWSRPLGEALRPAELAFSARRLPAWGELLVVAGREGLRAIRLAEQNDPQAVLQGLRGAADVQALEARRDDALLAPILDLLEGFLERPDRVVLDLPVDAAGTAFQRATWAALCRIGVGELRSYGELATALGQPGAARAVGGACGANPVPFVVPCHRVVGASGRLTGFGLGLPLKRHLIALERGETGLPF